MLLTSWLRQLPGLMARRAVRGAKRKSLASRQARRGAAVSNQFMARVESLEQRDLLTPSLLSIVRQDPAAATTSADSLVFRATFNEAVTGVDVNDFVVNGNTSAAVTAVSGSGAVYDITVSGGNLATFEGTVGLNVALSTITIPNSGLTNPYPLKRTVSGVSGTITDLNVRINNLTHTFPQDLEALLVAPSGEKTILFGDAGGGSNVVNLTFTLDDSAAAEIPDGFSSQLTATSYRPASHLEINALPAPAPSGPHTASLATFNGINPNGVWQLFLGDDFQDDGGTLGGFTLIITTANGTTEFTTASVTINAVSNNSALPAVEPATDEVYTLEQPLPDFQVTTLDDEDDGQMTQDADLSLREAIRLANANADASVITFAPSLFTGGDQTISLSLFDTGLDSTEFGPSAFIVSTDIDILGPTGDNGLTIERSSGASNFRLFHVQSAGNLTLDSLTLSGGRAIGLRGSGGGGSSAGMGGAIFNQGTLNVRGSLLVGNVAAGAGRNIGGSLNGGGAGVGSIASGTTGGGPNGGNATSSAGGFGGGGGVISDVGGPGGFGGGGGGGTATAGNGGFGGGGGGAHTGGTPGTGGFGGGNGTAGDSNPFGGNTSFGGGGAGMGGAIFNLSGTVNITNSTLTANSAFNSGGSVLDGKGLGGALFTVNGTTTINSSTFSANRADGGDSGGAVYAFNNIIPFQGIPGGLQLVTINNSILANSLNGATDFASDKFGLVFPGLIGVGNLIESNATTNGFAGTIVSSADPNLAALADNGGPTQTFALNAGSPAIDAGDSVAGAAAGDFDQRGDGFGRLTGDGIDIGAFEVQVPPSDSFIVTTLDDEDDADTSDPSDLSLREAIRLANADANDSVITFDPSNFEGPAEITLGGTALTISSNVTITGPGARTLAISGNNASRVFNVDDGSAATNATVAISGLSITDGAAVTGAGIFNRETLTLTAMTIQDNASSDSGAGLFNTNTGNLTVRDSTISNNIASTSGGGIANVQGQLTVLNSTISSNSAQRGGGLYEIDGTVALKNVTITGNSATTGAGGGLLIEADGVEMHNTIVAGNTAATGGNDIFDQLGMANGGLSASSSHNVVGDPTGFDALTDGTNFNRIGDGSGGVRPIGTILNTSIANNGGPTDTHALVTGSIALNNGDNSIATAAELTTDQRGEGFVRVRYGTVDSGAFEFFVTPTLDVTLSSGTLTVTDGDETGINNDLKIQTTETDVIISDATESFDADQVALISGATLSNSDRTLTIPLTSITAGITIDGALGTDTLTVLHTLLGTLNFTGQAESITVESPSESTLEAANVTLVSDELHISTVIDVGTGTVTLQPQTAGQLINLGGADAANTLGLTDAELDFITAGKVVIGNSDSGTITVSNDATPGTTEIAPFDAFRFAPSSAINFSLTNTTWSAVGFTVGAAPLSFQHVTASPFVATTAVTGGIFSDASGKPGMQLVALNTPSVAATQQTLTAQSDFTLSANTTYWFVLQGTSEDITPTKHGNGTPTVMGGTFVGYSFTADSGAAWFPESRIPFMTISVTPLEATSTISTLQLVTGGAVEASAGSLQIENLAVTAGGAVTLTDSDTAIGTVAITTSGAITITQSDALTVSTVGSQSGIDNSSGAGNVSLTSSAAGITVADGGLKSSGNVTISAAGNFSSSGAGLNNSTGTGTVSVTTNSGTLTSGGSGIQSKGAVTLSAPGLVTVQDAGLSNSSGTGDVSITSSAAGVTIASSGVQSAGNVTINAAGNVSLQSGNIDNRAGTGTVSVTTSSGTLTSDGSGIQSKGAVTLSAPGLVSVLSGGVNNSTGSGDVSITSTGAGVTTANSGISSSGDVTINAAGDTTLAAINNSTGTGKVAISTSSGTITTNSGTITSKGNVSFNAPGLITIGSGGVNVTSSSTQPTVTVTSTTAGITVTSGGIKGKGDVSLLAAGDILVTLGGIVNTSGTGRIDVVTSSGAVTIESTGLQSKGDVTVQGTGLITVKNSGISNSTGTGKVSVTTTGGGISSSGSGIQSTGDISLSAAGNISVIDGGAVNTSGTGKIDVTTTVGTVTISGSGLQSKGNITVSAPGAISISQGGVGVGSSDAATISITSTGADGSITNGSGGAISGKGIVGLTADQIQLGGPVSSDASVTLQPATADRQIDLGTETEGKLSLTDAELNQITAGTIVIGGEDSGAITISAALDQPTINTLQLNGNTTFAAGSSYTFQIGSEGESGNDRIDVNGTLTIDPSATLTFTAVDGFVFEVADQIAIIANDGTEAISGTFAGYPSATVLGTALPGVLVYNGGTNRNDVVLLSDATPPTAVIENVAEDPRFSSIESLTVTFSEDVTGVDIGDFTLTRDGETVALTDVTLTGSGANYTIEGLTGLTGTSGVYVLTLRATETGIEDAAGNELEEAATEEWFFASTAVTTEDGTITIDDVGGENNGPNTDDVIIISRDPENESNFLLTYEGRTFSLPLEDLDHMVINGGTGDDTLVIDGSHGALPFQITFNGESGGNDAIEIENFDDSFTAYTVNYTNAHDGTILLRNGSVVQNQVIFTGLDPLTIDGTPTDIIFNLTAGHDSNVVLEDINGPDGFMRLSGSTFETTTFSIGAATSITINTLAGNDKVHVRSIDSTYTGSLTVNTGEGNDSVNAAGVNLSMTLNGGAGNDSLVSGSGNDLLIGDVGNDTLLAGSGDDELSGGAGTDSINGQDGSDCLIEAVTGNVTITNTSVSGFGADKILSIECYEITGDARNNLMDASKFTLGRVKFTGGDGNDTLIGGSGNDELNGGNGFDIIRQSASVSQTLTNTSVTGSGNDTLTSIEGALLTGLGRVGLVLDASGFAGKATLEGTSGADTLFGGSGASVLNGNDGNDSIVGGSGVESLSGGKGNDTILGNDGHDTIRGGDGNDSLLGNNGDDRMFGDGGNDRMFGGSGQDLLDGGAGNDTMLGEAGHDSMKGGDGNDAMSGGTGDDSIDGQGGHDTILGGAGNDTLRTAAGNDRALGEDGNDRIESLAADTISGGAGTNEFIGPHARIDEAFVFDFDRLLV